MSINIFRLNLPDATYFTDELFNIDLDELDKSKRYSIDTLSARALPLTLEHAKLLKTKIEEIVGNFPEMDITMQLHKIVYTYDYMLKNVKYYLLNCGFSREMFLDEAERSAHVGDAYGALINGKALCAGLSEALVLILKHPKFNIKSSMVEAECCGIPHSLIRVELGNSVFYIDPSAELKFDPNTEITDFKMDYLLVSANRLIQKGYTFERSSQIFKDLKIYKDSEDYDRGMLKAAYEKLNKVGEKRIKIIGINNHGR